MNLKTALIVAAAVVFVVAALLPEGNGRLTAAGLALLSASFLF